MEKRCVRVRCTVPRTIRVVVNRDANAHRTPCGNIRHRELYFPSYFSSHSVAVWFKGIGLREPMRSVSIRKQRFCVPLSAPRPNAVANGHVLRALDLSHICTEEMGTFNYPSDRPSTSAWGFPCSPCWWVARSTSVVTPSDGDTTSH